ncbi:aminotransferase class IV [Maribacter hydrothermalis]|uniref:Aminotransferase IV n=1 Tax=Maribacter hydrothermalis TaxID=1836467 RepID=A0A1B7Z8H4_9FLAO|nr:aminotransferase class IV [Maribacter hydrothermalis]APQ18992.1 aminotransferase IV [Maribacter hydrothermalis]OBR38995.1 aminotransferase IV [Maribacter hydrothermalis]
MNYPDKVYINGQIVNPEDAKVSVFDRGFIFGDGLYEVMVQINGKFFYEKKHLERLQSGLDKINIDFDAALLPNEIARLLKTAQLTDKDCMLYIQITRGVAPRQHSYPSEIKPTVMMYAVPKVLPKINMVNAHVITRKDFRWSRCDIKMTSLLGNVMLNEEAMQHNCYETILHRNGVFTEASHCNVFFVKNGVVYTHKADEYILNGITRIVVIELCNSLGIEIRETAISLSEINTIDEAFLTGTSTQIAAIQQIDDYKIYTGNEKGPVTQRLQEAFLKLK